MVQQAELEPLARMWVELPHRELAFVTVAQDAHLLVQHDVMLLLLVWLEELIIKVGVGDAVVEARGKKSQGRW